MSRMRKETGEIVKNGDRKRERGGGRNTVRM